MRCKAFSLVEMLVVMAILSVLAALLLPVLQNGFAAAVRTKCAQTERVLHLGLSSYCNESGGVVPPKNWYHYGYVTAYEGAAGLSVLYSFPAKYIEAGGRYGGLAGLGYVIAAGYYGSPDDCSGVCEPTYCLSWSASAYQRTPEGIQSELQSTWKGLYDNPSYAASWIYSRQNGYYYRSCSPAADKTKRIHMLSNKAALWCALLSWYGSVPYVFTHSDGANCMKYDGSMRFFADPGGELSRPYTDGCYGSPGFLYSVLDKQ